jgi:hypothetical protein
MNGVLCTMAGFKTPSFSKSNQFLGKDNPSFNLQDHYALYFFKKS